jgi:hypothetical protein
MSALLFAGGIALLALAGSALWRLDLDVPARIAVCLSGGIVAMTTLMFALSLLQIPWTRVSLLVTFAVCVAVGRTGWKSTERQSTVTQPAPGVWLAIAVPVLMTLYGVLTARETCGDLLFFWGPKAVRFFYAEGIDPQFLAFPHYYLMHADYPPLIPLTYDWGSMVAHRFSWWGALLFTPMLLLATVAAFRGIVARGAGERNANRHAVLLAALLGFGYARGMVAGAGEPPLIFFETIALAALTFAGEDDRTAALLATVALAGAVFTKVEGTAFAALVLAAFVLTRRRIATAVVIAAPSVILLGSWLLYARHFHLLDSYTRREPLHPELLGQVVSLTARRASYGVFYLPWLAAVAPLPFGRNLRRAALPLITAAGAIAYTLYFYLHAADPAFWIASSAERVLLTALMSLVVASAAASE